MNRGRCRLRLLPGRWRGVLWFRCVRASHDHSEERVYGADWWADPESLYEEMTA